MRVSCEDVRRGLEEQAGHREGPAPRRFVKGRVVAAGGVRAVGVGVDGEEISYSGHVALEGCHVQAGFPVFVERGRRASGRTAAIRNVDLVCACAYASIEGDKTADLLKRAAHLP